MSEEENMEISPAIEKVDLVKLKNPIFLELVEAGLITREGFRISGLGMVIRRLEEVCRLQDKTNLKLYTVENAIRGVPKPTGTKY